MKTTKLIIPVSWDYGAERYSWHSPFLTADELKQWWLQEVNLLDFEQKLRSGNYPEFEDESDRFYELLEDRMFHLHLIDAQQDGVCFLIIGNQRIHKDGVIYTLNSRKPL